MHIGLHLYALGAGVSYRSHESGYDVGIRVKMKTKAKDSKAENTTNLSLRAVVSGFNQLEADGCIQRRKEKGYRLKIIYLLDPQTRKRLQTHPMSYGLFSSNAEEECFSFITLPRDCLKAIDQMKHASEKGIYLAALALASKERNEIVAVDRSLWQKLANVSKNTFTAKLKTLIRKKLLSYRRGVLILHDPMTGKPSERWRNEREFIYHENAKWAFDLNGVKPEEWHTVLEKALRQTIPFFNGWQTVKDFGCPFCGAVGKFSLSFDDAGFRCRACRDGHGKLGQLVKHALGADWNATKDYIKETIQAAALATI